MWHAIVRIRGPGEHVPFVGSQLLLCHPVRLHDRFPEPFLGRLRGGLTRDYDDCEDRPLTDNKLVECQMNREIWHSVNRVWQELRASPAAETESVSGLARFWQRVADVLDQQLSRRTDGVRSLTVVAP